MVHVFCLVVFGDYCESRIPKMFATSWWDCSDAGTRILCGTFDQELCLWQDLCNQGLTANHPVWLWFNQMQASRNTYT